MGPTPPVHYRHSHLASHTSLCMCVTQLMRVVVVVVYVLAASLIACLLQVEKKVVHCQVC